ncbi:hypothetical protein TSUD_194680 [Trifolium subterraneum]|uniref:Bulb-type lectin domain-containing protein n=1 Tax=Trifolium subterraneum TaxID=3900 RepID=A0A2Z6P6I7_TRISU|nr:hypothetical protein TSUD_194680 [Trifolium subterraneum]
MASMLVLSFLLFFFMLFTLEEATHTTTENNNSSEIPLGSWLSPKGENTSWRSSSGHFAFGFYPQGSGFAVGIWLVSPSENTTTVVWTANRDDPTVSSESMLNLTKQGLLLQNGKGDSPMNIDSSRYYSYSLVSWGSMLDSGNFVLYDENPDLIWQSFDDPTDTILGGQNFTEGDHLHSSISKSDHSSGLFYLEVTSDGNVVAYPYYSLKSVEDAYWDSNTSSDYQQHLSLSIQGSLCLDDTKMSRTMSVRPCNPTYRRQSSYPCQLRNLTGSVGRLCFNNSNEPGKKSHNKTTSIYRATLDVDGILRLYEHQFHFEQGNNSSHVVMLWQALQGTCQVKGFCGLNSYCTSNESGDAVCKCYPGFIPSNTKSNPNMPMVCIQMLSKDDCERNKDGTLLYNFTHFKNMYWGDIPYSVIPVSKMETCEKACQQDCVCVGAIYTNGSCNKYSLPLIYGSVQNDSSTVSVALVKVPSSTIAIISPTTSNDNNVPKPKVAVDNKRSLIMILSFTLGKEDASVSAKADIYSFGVVLLEIICRRRSIEMNNISSADEILLSNWVYQCFTSDKLNKLIKHDEKDVDWKILERMVKVGLWCVQDHQSLRPAMKNVILMLEGLKDIPVPPSPVRLVE